MSSTEPGLFCFVVPEVHRVLLLRVPNGSFLGGLQLLRYPDLEPFRFLFALILATRFFASWANHDESPLSGVWIGSKDALAPFSLRHFSSSLLPRRGETSAPATLSRADKSEASSLTRKGASTSAKWRTSRRVGDVVTSSSTGAVLPLAVLVLTVRISRHYRRSQTSTGSADSPLRRCTDRYIGDPIFPRRRTRPGRRRVFDKRPESIRPWSSGRPRRNSDRWPPIRGRPGRTAPFGARRPGWTGEGEPPMSRTGPRKPGASATSYVVVRGSRGLGGGREGGDEAGDRAGAAAGAAAGPRAPPRRIGLQAVSLLSPDWSRRIGRAAQTRR